MKTISELAAMLKRTGSSFAIWYSASADKFIISNASERGESKHLDDAIENLNEAMRRHANDMQPIRGATPAATSQSSTTTYIPPFSNLPSISQAAQQAKPDTCPTCGQAACATTFGMGGYIMCTCPAGHSWKP